MRLLMRWSRVCAASVLLCASIQAHEGHSTPAKVSDEIIHRPTAVPDRIVLTIHSDPATSMAVTWRTDTSVAQGLAEIQPADDGPLMVLKALRVTALTSPLTTNLGTAHYHSARFEGLTPKTKYAYRVGDGRNWSEWNHLTTASQAAEPFSFIYFGDAQNELKSHWSRCIREAYSDAPKAAFLLHAGDLINLSHNDAEWGDWFYAGSHIHRMIPCVPTPGNHEYVKRNNEPRLTPQWRPTFTLPENGPPGLEESVYWFDYQGARIISLNSNERFAEQADWLDQLLADYSAPWTIVTFHHPIYSTSVGRDNTALRKAWQPVLDKYRVDLVLQGHDHTYSRSGLMAFENVPTGAVSRSDVAGTVYVVSVSGPKMYALNRRPFMARAAENTQLYQIITIRESELHYEARTAAGNLYDAFTLRKDPGKVNKLIERVPETPERRVAVP